MTSEGPPLEELIRHLAECPADFLEEPVRGGRGLVRVDAVISDLLVALGGQKLPAEAATGFRDADGKQRNYLRLVLVCAWLLYHDWFRAEARFAPAARRWLAGEVVDLARLVAAETFVTDADRREELVRLCLRALEVIPAGETADQATDRLQSISSVERERVIRETRASEEAARKLRAAMERKRAKEAAAKPSREW
jgi:hypothetical protein